MNRKWLTLVVSFVIMHTIKSDSDKPNSLIVCSSLRIFPAWMSFCRSATKSDRVSCIFCFTTPIYRNNNKYYKNRLSNKRILIHSKYIYDILSSLTVSLGSVSTLKRSPLIVFIEIFYKNYCDKFRDNNDIIILRHIYHHYDRLNAYSSYGRARSIN